MWCSLNWSTEFEDPIHDDAPGHGRSHSEAAKGEAAITAQAARRRDAGPGCRDWRHVVHAGADSHAEGDEPRPGARLLRSQTDTLGQAELKRDE